MMVRAFFSSIALWVVLILIYLMFLSLRRSFVLSKSAFVILTDSYISLGWKIVRLSEVGGIKWEMEKVWNMFEEVLFDESWLWTSKEKLSKQVMDQVYWGYEFMFQNTKIGRGSNSEKFILVILVLYTGYVAVMSVVYFIWVFFLWLFGSFIAWVNTKYLTLKWNQVIKINQLFGRLDVLSDDIYEQKKQLKKSLKAAQNNDWKDGLLIQINNGIQNISQLASEATDDVVELRNLISESRYSDMFNENIYNAWIKKQITVPLQEVYNLLEADLLLIDQSIRDINEQIETTSKKEYKSALEMQRVRLEMQKKDIEQFIPQLEAMLEKLK